MHAEILNFGSLNIDHVYRVPVFVSPGETLTAEAYFRNAGGKGLNQSIAMTRAGLSVSHAGLIGAEGAFLKDMLAKAGADVENIQVSLTPTGHACIQVEDSGQNCILLYPGANRTVDEKFVLEVLDRTDAAWLLLQNEISSIPFIMREASRRGMKIAINPAPCDTAVQKYPLELADILFVNEIEAAMLSGVEAPPEKLAGILTRRFPRTEIVMTLGKDGALYARGDQRCRVAAMPVKVVDTTSAGDTFNGFYLAARIHGKNVEDAMTLANRAAAITVTRPGAAESIPSLKEVSCHD